MQKNTIGSMAIPAETAKGVFSFSFILSNMVFRIHCRLCRACEVKCKGETKKMQQSREVEF